MSILFGLSCARLHTGCQVEKKRSRLSMGGLPSRAREGLARLNSKEVRARTLWDPESGPGLLEAR